MRECLILSGGLGTRLAHLIPDLPKTLAPIKEMPFLYYLLQYLQGEKVDHYVFSLGYKSEKIIDYVKTQFPELNTSFVIEKEPLGTGGALQYAMSKIDSTDFFVINADTYYPISLEQFYNFHKSNNSDISLSVKPMPTPHRYGTVVIDPKGRIQKFKEKSKIDYGLINGGIYLINKSYLQSKKLPTVFSLENEVFEVFIEVDKFYAQVNDDYFLDIGIPEDYQRAQSELFNVHSIRPKRTLFLDRDGVINVLIPNNYVTNQEEFIFTEGFLDQIGKICSLFDFVFVVTNQQCIGKNIVSLETLVHIHYKMIQWIRNSNGFITNIYYCPHLVKDDCNCRKPNPGMLDAIRKDYPEVNFNNSLLIGDSDTDLQAAQSRNINFIQFNSTKSISKTENRLRYSDWESVYKFVSNKYTTK